MLSKKDIKKLIRKTFRQSCNKTRPNHLSTSIIQVINLVALNIITFLEANDGPMKEVDIIRDVGVSLKLITRPKRTPDTASP